MKREKRTFVSGRSMIVLCCLLGIFASLFAGLMPAQADAAGYKVKQWKNGDMYCYTVYTGTLPKMYEPTFYRMNTDNYYSRDGKIRIAVYSPYNAPTAAQADAFYRYLLSKSSKVTQAGYYELIYSDYTMRYVYKIEGWNQDKSLSSLLNAGPFWNEETQYRLELVNIGHGDQVLDQWTYLRKTLHCTTAVFFPVKSPRDGATIGLRFLDENGEPVSFLYN